MKKRTFGVAMMLTLALSGCSAPAAPDNSADVASLQALADTVLAQNEAQNEQTKDLTETPAAEESTSTSTADTIQIGEAGVLGDWGITASDAQYLDSIPDGYGSFSPDDGNKYLVVSISVTNNGKSASNFLPSFGMNNDVRAKILYGDGYEFSTTQLLGYSRNLHNESLNPLSTKEGDVVFEIPNNIADSSEELILCFSAGNSELNIKIR